MAKTSRPSPMIPPCSDPVTVATAMKTLLLTMGACSVRDCRCVSGSSTSTLDGLPGAVACDRCSHPLSDHDSYYPPVCSDPASLSPALVTAPLGVESHIITRPQFIDELIARLNRYHLIRVNGTPASGKTSMTRVLANELLARYPQTPVYLLCGWEWDDVRTAGGWALYLKQQLGTHGHRLITHPSFLLLDEAQQTYWDAQLWTDLFKSITGSSAVKVVLFTCYGSTGSEPGGATIMRELPGKTPMVFQIHQQISLRPEEDEEKSPRWKPVGLLLDEHEAHEILDRYVPNIMSSGADILTKELKHGLFLVSGGHAGLLVSLADALELIPEIYALIQKRQPLDWATVSQGLFGDCRRLFGIMQHLPFSRGLPRKQRVVQQSAYSSVLKNAIVYDGTLESSYADSPDQQRALQEIWKEGWLHAEIVLGDTRYVFPTQIHRWYCQCLFFRDAPAKELVYRSPLEMAIEAIRQFDPHQLSKAARTLEDQYQKEFYRCLFPLLLEYQIAMLPEYFIKQTGLPSGRIDFLVEQKKWGLELMRDGDRIKQHMQRFEKDGLYFAMIREELMEDYIVLNFTQSRPRRKYPGYRGHLYHVVFSEDCRNVQVLDASDLSEVVALVLVENAGFFR